MNFTSDDPQKERRPSKVEIRRKSFLILRKQISFEEKVTNNKRKKTLKSMNFSAIINLNSNVYVALKKDIRPEPALQTSRNIT